MWSSRAEHVVADLIARLPAEQLDPNRTHAQRLAALPIGWSLWTDYYLRPNGEAVIVGEDDDRPDLDSVHTDRQRVLLVLVWGSERYPELRELLPLRGPEAVDCICRNIPLFSQGKVLCPECCGLGWLPAKDQE